MEYCELMRQFGAKVGLPDLAPDETGVCRVGIDDMLVLFREDVETSRIMVWAEVGEPPPEGRERLYLLLMESMFMGQATGGATFSIESESGKVYLQRMEFLSALDADSFTGLLEKFVNLLEEWRRIIVDFRPVAEAIKKEADAAESESDFRTGGYLQV